MEQEMYRTAARLRKARKIVALWSTVPEELRPEPVSILASGDTWRREVETLAGVPVCSDDTWMIVSVLFEEP